MKSRFVTSATVIVLATVLSGCASFGTTDGVENLWREIPVERFEKGVTTQAEVLELLGPPSQLIALNEQTVFYYLTEKKSGKGKIFIIYNQVDASSKYDRAIFFFDLDGTLQEFAYSKEVVER